jgi:hypothetical protein
MLPSTRIIRVGKEEAHNIEEGQAVLLMVLMRPKFLVKKAGKPARKRPMIDSLN